MSAVKFRIEWPVDAREIRRIFDVLGEDLRDWSPAMIRVRVVLAQMFRKIFSSQGAALGSEVDVGIGVADLSGGWTPDSQETLRRKMRAGNASATLHLTGRLEASLASEGGTSDSIRGLRAGREGLPVLVFGTKLPWAAPNNFGSKRVPARPFMGITPEAKDQINEVLSGYLRERLAATAAALNQGGR